MISRRGFMAVAAGAMAATVVNASEKAMRLGGPIFVKSDDPAVLAKAHRDLGISRCLCLRATFP